MKRLLAVLALAFVLALGAGAAHDFVVADGVAFAGDGGDD